MRARVNHTGRHTQRGAALVVGLILLVILTLLALTGMNTASSELTMATNERLRDNAFRAAETGLEQATSVLSTLPQNNLPVLDGPNPVPGSPSDTFNTRTQYQGDGEIIPNMSVGKFIGFHYDIQATGTSVRNATMIHRAGAYVVGAGAGGETFGELPP